MRDYKDVPDQVDPMSITQAFYHVLGWALAAALVVGLLYLQ